MHLISPITNYPGSKGAAGLYQGIISLMPPHDVYIEGFLGSGKIMTLKRPARLNIGCDIDNGILHRWKHLCSRQYQFFNLPVSKVMSVYEISDKKVLYYFDPPYLKLTRKSQRDIYRYEWTDAQHESFLSILQLSRHCVILSGYDSDLYNHYLKGWNKKSFTVMTRGGRATESVWYNYADPIAIHDYSFLGENFTDRQRIKRKVNRWCKRFLSLPDLERNLIYKELSQSFVSIRP